MAPHRQGRVGTSTWKGAVSLLISRGTNPSTTATVRRVDSAAPGAPGGVWPAWCWKDQLVNSRGGLSSRTF